MSTLVNGGLLEPVPSDIQELELCISVIYMYMRFESLFHQPLWALISSVYGKQALASPARSADATFAYTSIHCIHKQVVRNLQRQARDDILGKADWGKYIMAGARKTVRLLLWVGALRCTTSVDESRNRCVSWS